jgi:hypothetical protein
VGVQSCLSSALNLGEFSELRLHELSSLDLGPLELKSRSLGIGHECSVPEPVELVRGSFGRRSVD